MRRIAIILQFITFAFCKDIDIKDLDSIRAGDSAMDKDTWSIYLERCYDENPISCKIILDSGLKTLDICHAKRECAHIGAVYFYAGLKQEALTFFRKARDKKEATGCCFVGLYHESGGNFKVAREIYEKLCAKKSASACFSLGNLYRYGNGVRQHYGMSDTFYKKACKHKDKKACYALGMLHEEGSLGVKNLPLAKELYGKACDLGYQIGCDEYKRLNKAGIPSMYKGRGLFGALS